MSRTWRKKSTRDHDRGSCPWCQGNLNHKHSKNDPPPEDEEFEPDRLDRIFEDEDYELEG